MNKDIQILAQTIYKEASHHNLSEMEAVANVVLNRVKAAQNGINTWWGQNIADVCLKPAQFSCWQHQPDSDKNNPIYQICHRVAVRAVKGLLKDNTNGGVYYHNINEHPKWAYAGVPSAQVGKFLFYDII